MHIRSFCITRCPGHSCRLSNEYPQAEQVMGGRRKLPWVPVMLLRRVCLHLGLAEDDIPFNCGLHGVFVCGVNGCPRFFRFMGWSGSFCGFIVLHSRSLVLRSGRIWLEAFATRSGGLDPAPVICVMYRLAHLAIMAKKLFWDSLSSTSVDEHNCSARALANQSLDNCLNPG